MNGLLCGSGVTSVNFQFLLQFCSEAEQNFKSGQKAATESFRPEAEFRIER